MEFKFLNFLQTIHNPIMDAVMCFVSKIGNVGMVWILLAVVLFFFSKTRRSAVILLTALVVDVILCNGILKNAIGRIRPCDVNTAIQLLIPRPSDFSFPSGHTAASFAAVTSLMLAHEKTLWKPAMVLAILIAFSRMYLYVHYPTDILGGILVGIVSGCLGYFIFKKFVGKGEKNVCRNNPGV